MNWNNAKNRIKSRIKVDTNLNTPKSHCRFVKAIQEYGFIVSIGKSNSIPIPWEMLEHCFLAISGSVYDGAYFRKHYPKQAAQHPCHVHVVGQIFVVARLAYLEKKKYFIRFEMETTENESPKEILMNELDGVINIMDAIIPMLKSNLTDAQFTKDAAEATMDLLAKTPNDFNFNYETQISLWESAKKSYKPFVFNLQNHDGLMNSASSDIYTAMTSGSISLSTFRSSISYSGDEIAINAVDKYQQVISRPEIKQEVIILLEKWGFDKKRLGVETVLRLFLNSHESFERNESAIAILISIRSSIKIIIDWLLQRRPKQEPASTEQSKIFSIGNQLKNDDIDDLSISEWATQYHRLNDILSLGKEDVISRDEIHKRLNQATTFILSFLKGLDINKVNKQIPYRHH
jgi:hypothetical protein